MPCTSSNNQALTRIGILAVAFGDGSLCLYSVPHPGSISSSTPHRSPPSNESLDASIYIQLVPFLEVSVPGTVPASLSWSNERPHRMLSVGCCDGSIYIWNIETLRLESESNACTTTDSISSTTPPHLPLPRPMRTLLGHEGCVQGITWFSRDRERFLATCGWDGRLCLWDLNDPAPCFLQSRAKGLTFTPFCPFLPIFDAKPFAAMNQKIPLCHRMLT